MLQQVYQEQTLSRSTVFLWHKRFKEGREDVEDNPRCGRPSISRNETSVELVKQMARGNRRSTVRLISDELGLNRNTVWKIITEDLGMRKVCGNVVPKFLNHDQEIRLIQVCQDILENFDSNLDMLKKVVTGDETWVFECDSQKPTVKVSIRRVINHHRSKK